MLGLGFGKVDGVLDGVGGAGSTIALGFDVGDFYVRCVLLRHWFNEKELSSFRQLDRSDC